MHNKISHRIYVSGLLTTQGPLLVGNGQADYADSDFVRDGCGLPLLPGSSLAGALRSALADSGVGAEQIDSLLGARDTDLRQSPLTLHDATLVCGGTPEQALLALHSSNQLRVRDCVRIDDSSRTARDHGKFDLEVIEKDVKFAFRCELTGWNSGDQTWESRRSLLVQMVSMLENEGVCIGAKTTRGFGCIKLEQTRWLELSMDQPQDAQKWLDFDWTTMMEQHGTTPPSAPEGCATRSWKFDVEFDLQGPLLVRSYTADPEEPDFVQFAAHSTPVIPGTSWAGIIRHATHSIVDEIAEQIAQPQRRTTAAADLTDAMFGPHLDTQDVKAQRSSLTVCESALSGETMAEYTRNRIDRFTGGVVASALFTECPAFPAMSSPEGAHMCTKLSLRLAERQQTGNVPAQAQIGALYLALCDMAHGLVPVGGESSIGRGILKGTGVNVTRPGGQNEQWSLDGSAPAAQPCLESLYQWVHQEEE